MSKHNPDNLWHYHDVVNEIIREALRDPENFFNQNGNVNYDFANFWWKQWKDEPLTQELYKRYFADFVYELPPSAKELAWR